MKMTDALRRDMEEKKIDVELSLTLLDRINSGKVSIGETGEARGIPGVDGDRIVDTTSAPTWTGDAEALYGRLGELNLAPDRLRFDIPVSGPVTLGADQLREIGLHLIPRVAYGVLNGGSATSYADHTKNRSFNETLYRLYEPLLNTIGESVRGKAKGLTPALFSSTGMPGASYLELKMRHLLLLLSESRDATGTALPAGHAPMFQMSSVHNNEELSRAYEAYRNSPLLKDLIAETGVDITEVRTGVQPMISAYTHSEHGSPRGIFDRAYGEQGRTLALPGGHGQSFSVLKSVYRSLRSDGFRFAYIGNVDNLGFTVDPVTVAFFALTGRPVAFEFAYKTPVDVKGGILIEDMNRGLTCGDIGPAVSKSYVEQTERAGTAILFNCATGLFDLDWLDAHIDRIESELPLRLSDQDKDAGRYSQAEQVTWEVIGMIDNPMIFAVDKYRRFLAAKLLSESFMTNGVHLDEPDFPTDENPEKDLKGTAKKLNAGLGQLLTEVYGWSPGD